MVLTAPELVVAEPVELLDQVEIATELQHRVLADRMVGRKERAETQAEIGHGAILAAAPAAVPFGP